MTADLCYYPNLSRKLTHGHVLPFDLYNIARPFQQQLSSCCHLAFYVDIVFRLSCRLLALERTLIPTLS